MTRTPWKRVIGQMTPERRAAIDAEKVRILNEHLAHVMRDRDFYKSGEQQATSVLKNLTQVGWYAGGRFIRSHDADDCGHLVEIGWIPTYVHGNTMQSGSSS